ncbi:hypothetical protein AJ79_07593 [Helicocarpus griseus UAMH5409]|uniref:Uncharacterized protein n=1 Tax=Helicocarpus griseus UAMH5409 TaxID=1447875 RepID=A0A2B7X132_9EURO|nr:hypothetical protein AJ79_07593 [Helicocarpus griseus UAMH5409]
MHLTLLSTFALLPLYFLVATASCNFNSLAPKEVTATPKTGDDSTCNFGTPAPEADSRASKDDGGGTWNFGIPAAPEPESNTPKDNNDENTRNFDAPPSEAEPVAPINENGGDTCNFGAPAPKPDPPVSSSGGSDGNLGAPSPKPESPVPKTGGGGGGIDIDKDAMVAALKIIMPATAKEPCVDRKEAPGECRSAEQAAAPLLRSFERYNITELGERAAILGLLAVESGEFAYRKNHYPGTPGQGTRNMQMPNFNAQYAASLDEIKEEVAKIGNDGVMILDLLLKSEEHDFGAAAWFLTTQCDPAVRAELQTGTEKGWMEYLKNCVHTTITEKAYWERAKEELGNIMKKREVIGQTEINKEQVKGQADMKTEEAKGETDSAGSCM